MGGKNPDWRQYWPMFALLIGFAVSGLIWGGGLTARVNAAEQTTTELKADLQDDLHRIEMKLDWLIDRLVGQTP